MQPARPKPKVHFDDDVDWSMDRVPLTESEKQTIVLMYKDGATQDEIASAVHRETGTVAQALHRMRKLGIVQRRTVKITQDDKVIIAALRQRGHSAMSISAFLKTPYHTTLRASRNA